MNERIRELALQAGAGEWGDSVIPAMMDIELFTRLIVRECVNSVNCYDALNILDHFGIDPEHFGVES